MQRRQDLWTALTSEVQLADMVNKTPNARAGKPEALRIAREAMRENDDSIVNELPSPLIAQPADLLRYQLGQLKPADLAKSQSYPVTRGGAWVSAKGRIVIVEFKDLLTEAGMAPITVAPFNRTSGAAPAKTSAPALRQRSTADLPPVKPYQAKHAHPNSYGPSDEGSHATVTVVAKHPKLYQMDWMPDQKVGHMGAHAGFHVFSEDTSIAWTPMTLQLYIKLAEQVKAARGSEMEKIKGMDNVPTDRITRPNPAPKPARQTVAMPKAGEEPQHSDMLGVAKPRKKFLGVF